MQFYEVLYYQLFAATADAVEALERMDFGCAKQILIQAQQSAEEQVLSRLEAGEEIAQS